MILTISVLVKVGEFLWKLREKKEALSESSVGKLTEAVEQNTFATKHLDLRLSSLEKSLSELPKFKTDIRRFYIAVKALAGDKWPEIRKAIMEENELL